MACILSFARFPAQNCPSKHERVYASSPSPFHININGPSSNYIAKKPRANNRGAMTTFFSIASLPQQLIRMSRLTAQVAPDMPPIVVAPQQEPWIDPFVKLMIEYFYMGGKPFFGTESAIEAQDWLDTCERIFGDIDLENMMKRKLASRQLQGRAMRWWNSVKNNPTPEDQITWETFKSMFEKQYITAVQKFVLFRKFVDLRQGDMSVTEYVTEFETLSKYGPSLINDPVKKNQKFVMGLNDPLGEMLLNHINEPFEELVEKALRHESLYPKPKSVVAWNEEPKSQIKGGGKKKWNNNKKQLQINAGQNKGSTGAGASVIRKIVDIADKDQVVDGSDCETKGHEFEPQK